MRIGADEIAERARTATGMLEACEVCPWRCKVDRRTEKKGRCRSGRQPVISAANLHRGEEPVISGIGGSGTIFFTNCTLRCHFCQNYPISQMGHGTEIDVPELAKAMLKLERAGAHNVNLVTPSHFTPQILEAAAIARREGLRVPFVWNSNGFERVETLRLLDGVVDVYLPDLKYADDAMAERHSGALDYWAVATAAIREMSRQVGTLALDADGIATHGLVIRHLVLPGGVSGAEKVIDWIARTLPNGTSLSLMGQFFPAGPGPHPEPADQKLDVQEYARACEILDRYPEIEGWTQNMLLPGSC